MSALNEPPFPSASTNDIAYDSQGNLHVAYYKSDTGDLYYAKRSSSGEWIDNRKIDGDGQVGGADVGSQLSLAICGDYPAIAYYDAANGNLKYVVSTGQAWTTPESADADNASLNIGASPSLVFNGVTPIVSYANWTNKNLRVSRKINGAWQKVHETASPDDTGRFTSIAIGSNGRWCVASANKTTGALVFTQSVDAQTTTETNIWTAASNHVLQYVSLAIDANGNPGISFCDLDPNTQTAELRFVKASGSTWGTPPELVDSSSTNEQYANLFFNNTTPVIAYQGRGAGSVDQAKLATKSGSVWSLSTMLSGYGAQLSAARASNGDLTFTDVRASGSSTALYVNQYPTLAAPTNLIATAASDTQVNLTWTDNSTNETGFAIEWSTNPTFATVQRQTIAAGQTSSSVTGLSPETTYYFRIYAYNAAGGSAATTASAITGPAAPTNLNAVAATSVPRIDLTWADHSSTETGFIIERSENNGPYSEIARVGSNVTSYRDWGSQLDPQTNLPRHLATNTAYTYRVRAYNANTESANAGLISPCATGSGRMFDILLYQNIPQYPIPGTTSSVAEPQAYGMEKISICTRLSAEPTEAECIQAARDAASLNQWLVVDLEGPQQEYYCYDFVAGRPYNSTREANTRTTVARFQRVVGWIHDEWTRMGRNDLKVGVYGCLPCWDYNLLNQANPDPTEFSHWQYNNELYLNLLRDVDFLAPSNYSVYDNQESQWQMAVHRMVDEARRLMAMVQVNKPIYAFVSPHRRGNSSMPLLSGDEFAMELDTLYVNGNPSTRPDGVIMFQGMGNMQWNDTAPWWLATKDFLGVA